MEQRAKQFRSYENIWPFRVPHEPLLLDEIITDALADQGSTLRTDDLRSRTVLRMIFDSDQTTGSGEHFWEAWVVTLPSGIMLYCDDDGTERRILASARRGNPLDADGFFLELLAETRGEAFGIQLAGRAPDRLRGSIADRAFLVDVFVELFEGTDAEQDIRTRSADATDFRADVDRWLRGVWIAPASAKSKPARRQPRRREESPS